MPALAALLVVFGIVAYNVKAPEEADASPAPQTAVVTHASPPPPLSDSEAQAIVDNAATTDPAAFPQTIAAPMRQSRISEIAK